jgi:UPF0755 protein
LSAASRFCPHCCASSAAGTVSSNVIILTIPAKSSLLKIAQILQNNGIIKNRLNFISRAVFTGEYLNLKAGEYALSRNANVSDVVRVLARGEVIVHKVTIPEGVTVSRIGEILQANPCLSGTISTFPAEGHALPGTYYFSKGTLRQNVLNQLSERMNQSLARITSRMLSSEEVLILASIVEKEAKISEEKQEIAGVFLARLQCKMRLQADPTVAYAVFGGVVSYPRPLTRQDCKNPSLYNTYVHRGLPPTAICCPGIDTLQKVAAATPSKYMYFVANDAGGHVFTETLAEHKRAVRLRKRNN